MSCHIVIAGLDPAIHLRKELLAKGMDARVKPAHDGVNMVRRRDFVLALVASAAAWPLAARAQQPKRPTIGFLGTATPSTWAPFTAAFVQRLRELGWIDGGNITIEVRWAEGRSER